MSLWLTMNAHITYLDTTTRRLNVFPSLVHLVLQLLVNHIRATVVPWTIALSWNSVLVCINLTLMEEWVFFWVHWQGIGKLHRRWHYCQSFHRMCITLSYLTSPMHHHPTWSSSHSLCPQLNQLTSLPWHFQYASSLFLQMIHFQHSAVKNLKANCPSH